MMPGLKYRKLPVEVEAVQWFKADDHPKVQDFSGQHCIGTLEGWMKVSPGDWIITGVKGECYPCKPDIFALTYEPATRPDGGDSLREALEKLKHLLSLKSLAEVRTMVVPNSGHTIAFQNDDFEYEGYLLRADVREAVRILAALTSLAAKDGG